MRSDTELFTAASCISRYGALFSFRCRKNGSESEMNISEVHEGIIVNVMLQLMILKPPGGETAVHAMRCVDLLT